MNTRWLLNLVLIAAVIALGVFISSSPDKGSDKPVTRIGGTEIVTVNRIAISREDLAYVRLHKTATGKWRMLEPYTVAANKAAINKLLELPKAISHTRFSADGRDLDSYGLAPEKASLELNEQRYLFGNIEHINKRRYIMLNGTVHLTTDLFYHQLRTAPEHFVSGRLVEENMTITSLELPGLVLNQTAQGDWAASGEQTQRDFSADAITMLLGHWRHKKVTLVDPAEKHDSTQMARVTFSDNSVIEYAIVKTDTELLMVRNDLGLQYHFPVAQAPHLLDLTTDNK